MDNPFPFELITHLATCAEGPPDIPAIERATDEMLRMMCQKTAGQPQYAKQGDIHVETNIDRVTANLLYGELRLVLSGYLDTIDCTGPIEHRVFEPASNKDRDRNEAAMREALWGDPIDAAGQKTAVQEYLQSKFESERKRWNLCMMCMCNVLSGRLSHGNPN